MNNAIKKYVRYLPIRWGIGGLVFSLVFIAIGFLEKGSAIPVPGLVRLLVVDAPPMCILGFLWGWSERISLERCAGASSGQREKSIRRTVMRQVIKGMICGAIFMLFIVGTGLIPMLRPWDRKSNILFNLENLLGCLVWGALVGLAVGIVLRRNLLRRLVNSPNANQKVET
jgi:hypothetical protein